MTTMSTVLLERLRSVTMDYADQRYTSEQDLRLYVWFHEHLYDEIVNVGGVERGYTFRQKGEMCLLVYKASFEGVHRVVFLTARTPAGCIHALCRRFYNDKLKWVDDKYA